MMYDELIKSLRNVADNSHYTSPELLKDAADAIENTSKAYQMMAEAYEAEVAKQDWIPVTERLPEDAYPVLVTYLGYNDKLPRSDMVAMYDDGDWYWYDDESMCKVIVTHWMPLPTPPKETQVMYYPQVDGITPTLITPREDEA